MPRVGTALGPPQPMAIQVTRTTEAVGVSIETVADLTGVEIAFGGDLARSLKGGANYYVIETEAQGWLQWTPYPGQLRLQAGHAVGELARGLLDPTTLARRTPMLSSRTLSERAGGVVALRVAGTVLVVLDLHDGRLRGGKWSTTKKVDATARGGASCGQNGNPRMRRLLTQARSGRRRMRPIKGS